MNFDGPARRYAPDEWAEKALGKKPACPCCGSPDRWHAEGSRCELCGPDPEADHAFCHHGAIDKNGFLFGFERAWQGLHVALESKEPLRRSPEYIARSNRVFAGLMFESRETERRAQGGRG